MIEHFVPGSKENEPDGCPPLPQRHNLTVNDLQCRYRVPHRHLVSTILEALNW